MRYAAFLIALISLSGCFLFPDNCVITVQDTCVKKSEFRQRFAQYAVESNISSKRGLENIRKAFAEDIIKDELVLHYAAKNGLFVSQESVSRAYDTLLLQMPEKGKSLSAKKRIELWNTLKKRLLIEKASKTALVVSVDEYQVKQYYDEHTSDFVEPEAIRLRQFYFDDYKKARDALNMMRSGVSSRMIDKRYGAKQFTGTFKLAALPEDVRNILLLVPTGRYSDIVIAKSGYHVFYVEKRLEEKKLSFENTKQGILKYLYEDMFEKSYALWIRKLYEEYKPEVDWNSISRISVY